MVKVNKVLPQELKAESHYAVRVRSINNLGTASDWSEYLIADTTAAGLASARRLVITNDGMIAYNSNGQITFNYSATAAIRTNLCTNPSGEIDTTGWLALTNSTLSVTTAGSEYFVGVPTQLRSFKVLANIATNNIGFVTDVTKRAAVTPLLNYTVAAYVKIPVGQQEVYLRLGLRFYDVGGVLLTETVSLNKNHITGNNWIRISNVGMTAPAGTATVGFVIYSSDSMPANSYYLVDGILIEQTSILRDYFDGSSSAGTSTWVGVAHNSASTLDNNGIYSVNGGVFTESTIQTSRVVGLGIGSTSNGVVLDRDGLRVYPPTGTTPTFEANATTGVVTITGYTPVGTAVLIGGAAADVNANVTTINGGMIRTGLIQSTSYSGVTDGSTFSTTGTTYNLNNGSITSKQFRVDTSGNAVFGGSLSAASGSFVGAVSGGTIDIGGADTTSFHVDASGNMWMGNATYSGAPFQISSTGVIRAGSSTDYFTVSGGYTQVYSNGGGVTQISGGSIFLALSTGANVSSQQNLFLSSSAPGPTEASISLQQSTDSIVMSTASVNILTINTGGITVNQGSVYIVGGANNRFMDSSGTNWFTPRDASGNMHIKAGAGTTDMYFDAAIHYFRTAAGSNKFYVDGSGNTRALGNIEGNNGASQFGAVWPSSGAYTCVRNSGMSGSAYALLCDSTNTYIGSGSGSTHIRGPNNGTTAEIEVTGSITNVTGPSKFFSPIGGGGAAGFGTSGGAGAVLVSDAGSNNIHFNWDGAFRCYVDSSLVKTFVIEHPVDENKYLVHACAEGPTADVFYRGEGQLVNGECMITLPDYFEALTELEGRTVQLTPIYTHGQPTADVAASRVVDGKFSIGMLAGFVNDSQGFYWRVDAIRKNTTFEVEPNKNDVIIAGDGPYTYVAG